MKTSPLFLDQMKFPTPEVRAREIITLAMDHVSMAAIVLSDEAIRHKVGADAVEEYAGFLIQIDRKPTPKQMLVQLASVMQLPTGGTASDLQHRITECFESSQRPILIDGADLLDRRHLHLCRDFHDEARIPVIFIGATRRLMELVEDVDQGGQLSSRMLARVIVDDSDVGAEHAPRGESDGVIGRIVPEE